jgi:hypothetical protein
MASEARVFSKSEETSSVLTAFVDGFCRGLTPADRALFILSRNAAEITPATEEPAIRAISTDIVADRLFLRCRQKRFLLVLDDLPLNPIVLAHSWIRIATL